MQLNEKVEQTRHNFIDWYFNAKEIKSFCSAFDKPYEGAKTFLGKSGI